MKEMAKKQPKVSNMDIEDALNFGNSLTNNKSKKEEIKKRDNQKVLYVGASHHLKAKGMAFNKGFLTLRAYIENLIDNDK